MTDLFQELDDATPLDPALRGDLLQTWITSCAELKEAEEESIVKGAVWGRRSPAANCLSVRIRTFSRLSPMSDHAKSDGVVCRRSEPEGEL